MIQPTVGRVVHYYPGKPQGFHPSNQVAAPIGPTGLFGPAGSGPLCALVCKVWSDRLVSLVVFDENGFSHPRNPVPLVQPQDEVPEGEYATWMPYQVKKGFGSESGEKAAGSEEV